MLKMLNETLVYSDNMIKIIRARNKKKINDKFIINALEEGEKMKTRVKITAPSFQELVSYDMFVDGQPRLLPKNNKSLGGKVAKIKAKFESKIEKEARRKQLELSVSSKRIQMYDPRKYMDDYNNTINVRQLVQEREASIASIETESMISQDSAIFFSNPKKRVKLSRSILEKSKLFEDKKDQVQKYDKVNKNRFQKTQNSQKYNITDLPLPILKNIFKNTAQNCAELRLVCSKFKRVIDVYKTELHPRYTRKKQSNYFNQNLDLNFHQNYSTFFGYK